MIPVFQTMTVTNDGHGNCFNACVASILEMPLRDVAQIHPATAKDWVGEWDDWFAARGLENVTHRPNDPPKGYSIACGQSSRIYPAGHRKEGRPIQHACVAFDGVVVHDPYPIRGEFSSILCYQNLEPLA